MKHFTQRTLMEHFMRPQDYESMVSVAERTWARCAPASDQEDPRPSTSQCAPDSNANAQGAPDEVAGSVHDRRVVSDEGAGQQANVLSVGAQECMNRDSDHSGQGGAVRAAAEYIRSTVSHGGLHIGGIYLPSLVLEG